MRQRTQLRAAGALFLGVGGDRMIYSFLSCTLHLQMIGVEEEAATRIVIGNGHPTKNLGKQSNFT